MTNRLLITGASGYIGSHLLRDLLLDEFQVLAIVRPETDLSQLPSASDRFRIFIHSGQTLDMVNLIAEFRPEIVYHLAAVGGMTHETAHVDGIIRANISLGIQVLEGLVKVGGGCFINTGSFFQHFSGDTAYDPNSLYAATKQAFQDVLVYYSRVKNIRSITLKLFDVYGSNDSRKRLFDILSEAQRTGCPLNMSPGQQLLDLVHVDDVVDAYRFAAKGLKEGVLRSGKDYTVSSGVQTRLREAVKLFEKVSGKPVCVRWGGRSYREREIMVPFEGEKLPGWYPKISLEQGLKGLI